MTGVPPTSEDSRATAPTAIATAASWARLSRSPNSAIPNTTLTSGLMK